MISYAEIMGTSLINGGMRGIIVKDCQGFRLAMSLNAEIRQYRNGGTQN